MNTERLMNTEEYEELERGVRYGERAKKRL